MTNNTQPINNSDDYALTKIKYFFIKTVNKVLCRYHKNDLSDDDFSNHENNDIVHSEYKNYQDIKNQSDQLEVDSCVLTCTIHELINKIFSNLDYYFEHNNQCTIQ